MNTPQARPFSASDAVGWALAFLRREWMLAAPVTLAFLVLPVVVAQMLLPASAQIRPDGIAMGPMLMWMIPVLLIGLFGGLCLTALAARPGSSVGEAIALAARRFGTLLLAIGIVFLGLVVALSLFSLVGVLGGASEASLARLGQVAVVAAMMLVGARLLPLLPVVATEPGGPVRVLRRAYELSRGHFLRLFGLAVLMLIVAVFVTVIAQQTIGAVFLIGGRVSGQTEIFAALGTLILGTIGGAVSTVCYVVVTAAHRQLTGRG